MPTLQDVLLFNSGESSYNSLKILARDRVGEWLRDQKRNSKTSSAASLSRVADGMEIVWGRAAKRNDCVTSLFLREWVIKALKNKQINK